MDKGRGFWIYIVYKFLPIGYNEVAERDISKRGEGIFWGGGLESDGTAKEDQVKKIYCL